MKNQNRYAWIIIVLIVIIGFFMRSYPRLKKIRKENRTELSALDRNLGIVLTKHARCRMACRDISEQEIKEIINNGTIDVERSDPEAERGAEYALEGYSHERQHLRVIVSPHDNKLVVISCIDLDKEWKCDCN
jgi:hypothetical protein